MLRDVVSLPLTLSILCLLEVPAVWVNGVPMSLSVRSDLVAGAVEEEAEVSRLKEP